MHRVLFLHIMKTAGTAFREILSESLEGSMFPSDEDLEQLPGKKYPTNAELIRAAASEDEPPAAARVLCGHYPFVVVDALPGDWAVATFLRDPIERTISMMAHRSRNRGRLHGATAQELLDDEDFVAHQVQDYQTKVFAIDDLLGDVNMPYAVDERSFERALGRLEASDFVGLTDRFAESVDLFSVVTGIELTRSSARRNIGVNVNDMADGTDSITERLHDLLKYDIALYERAEELFRAAEARHIADVGAAS